MALYDSSGNLLGAGATEADPTVPAPVKQVTADQIADWDAAALAVDTVRQGLLEEAVTYTTTNTGKVFVWNNAPALDSFELPITAKSADVLLAKLAFRVNAAAAGTLTFALHRYGESRVLFSTDVALAAGENAVEVEPNLLLAKGVEYAMSLSAPEKIGYPVVYAMWRTENEDLDTATASAYKYNNSNIVFAGDITYRRQADLAGYPQAEENARTSRATLDDAARQLTLRPYCKLLGAADAKAVDAVLTVDGDSLTVSGHAGQYAAWTLPVATLDRQQLRLTATLSKLTGGLSVVLAGTQKNSTEAVEFALVTPTGTGSLAVDVDLAWYDVYSTLDLAKTVELRAMTTTADSEARLDELSIAEKVLELDGVDSAGASLGSVLERLQAEAAQGSTGTGGSFIAPGGAKYLLQVSDSGAAVFVPVVPNKALFVGNSLLVGFGTFGMCASDANNDYYALATAYLTGQNAVFTAGKAGGTALEAAEDTAAFDAAFSAIAGKTTADLDLIVVQLGDNVNTEAKRAYFRQEGAKRLLQALRAASPRARVVWMAAWYSADETRTAIRDACADTGCLFVDISDLATDANKAAVGDTITYPGGSTSTVESSGVASHPGNAGMKAIANRLLYRLGVTASEAALA